MHGQEVYNQRDVEKTQAALCRCCDLNVKCPPRGSCLKTWSPADGSLEGCRTCRKWCLAGGKFQSRNTVSCLLLLLASPRRRGAPAVASCPRGASCHYSFLFMMYEIFKFNQTVNQNMPFVPSMLQCQIVWPTTKTVADASAFHLSALAPRLHGT